MVDAPKALVVLVCAAGFAASLSLSPAGLAPNKPPAPVVVVVVAAGAAAVVVAVVAAG